ncbi:hypothetical protein FI667_g13483, partial [Globisporangium splendens]
MAFSIASSGIVPLQGIRSGDAPQEEKQLLHKKWTISGVNELQALRIQVPGAVFVDYDATLEPAAETKTTDIGDSRVETNVAKIVVTSDSRELIDFSQVAPFESEKKDKGVNFCAMYQNADLEGTLLTQISVSRKAMLRYFSGQLADFVIGEDVLVHNDPEADIVLQSLWSGSMYLTLKDGFDVHSLKVMQGDCGTFQLHVPSIHAKVSFASVGEDAKLVIVSDHDIVSPDSASIMPMMGGNVLVQTPEFTTDVLMIWDVMAGSARFLGHGSAKKEVVIVAGTCTVDTKAIVAEDAHVGVVWSGGDVTVQAANKLDVRVTKQHLRWSRPVVQQAMPTEDHIPVEPYKLREPPKRVPKQVHIRATKPSMFSWRNKELRIEPVNGTKVQPASHVGRTTALIVGVAAAATVVTLLLLRRR